MVVTAPGETVERLPKADRQPPGAVKPKPKRKKKKKPPRELHVGPQSGFQVDFLSSRADITIGGGSAGVGKTYGELLAAARHHHVKGFQCVFFRRSMPQITGPDGLWDQGMSLYPAMGGTKHSGEHRFRWPHGATIKMAHLEHDDTVLNWQGTQIALGIFDELTHFCVTPETEVLTESGWKPITEVVIGERVASLTADRRIVLQRVMETPQFDFDGYLLTAKQKLGVSFRVTPNHRMVVDRQDAARSWKFVPASHLEDAMQMIPRVGSWDGVEARWVEMPKVSGRGIGRNANQADGLPADDYLGLLGWWLAEGSCFLAARSQGGTSPCTSIRQTKDSAPLAELMAKLPWRVRPDGDGGYRIFSRQLFDHFHPLGDAKTKRVPRWVFGLTRRQQRIVLDAFLLGDGHRGKAGGTSVGLCNRGLADDVQELAFYCGLVATRADAVVRGRFNVHRVQISSPKRTTTQIFRSDIGREQYKGPVHCLTVEGTGTFLMRHNGRACWTGNSAKQFWYMLSRNRSTCGVQPYMLATCNPDADSWVAELIAWWIEQNPNSPRYGLPILERAGKLRYFARIEDKLIWADSRQELVGNEQIRELIYDTIRAARDDEEEDLTFDKAARIVIKSLTFIPGKLEDNKILQRKDPGYRGRLLALTRVEKERLLYGNWKARQAQGEMFRRHEVKLLDAAPTNLITTVRCWDLAATEESTKSPDPDFTSGVKMGKYEDGRTVILDFINVRKRAHEVRQLVRRTAENDTVNVRIRLHQDPAQAGKDQAQSYVAMLNGFIVHADTVSGDKVTNAEPLAAQWQAGNVDVVRALWNDEYFGYMEAFPDPKVHDDPVDASATGYKELNQLRPILEVKW